MPIEDILYRWKGKYRTSPQIFKAVFGSLYASFPMRIRYGRILTEAQRFLEVSQYWSWEQHKNFQLKRLKQLAQHAFENVPYYRRKMVDSALGPDFVQDFNDWKRLPTITKETLRIYKQDMIAENMKDRLISANTGGSTGDPLDLFWEKGRTRSLERAFMWRQWAWAGFPYGKRTAVIRGQTVRQKLFDYDPIDRHLFVNAYNMSEDTLKTIVSKLRKFRPVSIQAYPSTLTILALWMKDNNEGPIPDLKVVLCGSENLYPDQKALFEEVFNVRVYNWYGHGESCCMAGYCDKTDYYHVYSEYGFVELIDADGNVLDWNEGQRGEIVATSFVNDAMPLIRYRTGDIAVAGPSSCVCGRHYRLFQRIEGRKQEYIVTSDGRAIPLTGLIFGQHWQAFSKISKLQLLQDEPGRVILRIVKRDSYNDKDEQEIRTKMTKCVRLGLKITFDYVDHIEPTARGKHVFIKQSVPIPSTWAGDFTDSQFQ